MAKLDKLLARAAPILARLPAGRPLMVEVGTYAGDLAQHLLQARGGLVVHCVDPWLPVEQQPDAYVASGDVHAVLPGADQDRFAAMTRARLAAFPGRATIWREASPGAAAHFADGAFDLAFTDARHDRGGVLADLLGWWPKVKPGGWLGAHDYANPDPRFMLGVDAAAAEFSVLIGLPFELDSGMTVWWRKP